MNLATTNKPVSEASGKELTQEFAPIYEQNFG